MNTILDYLTIDALTMYENNVKSHFVEYVEPRVDFVWRKKFIVSKIRNMNIAKKEKDAKVNELCSQLRKIKNDLLDVESTQYKSHSSCHIWINQQKQHRYCTS